MFEMTLGELADRIGATLANGDRGVAVSGVASITDAGPADVTFLNNPSYRRQLEASRAGAAVVGRDVDPAAFRLPLLIVDNPDLAFGLVALALKPPPEKPAPGVHPTAIIDPGATLGEDVSVGAYTVVENGAVVGARTVVYPRSYIGAETSVGEDCILYPNVILCHRVSVGNRCIIHSGAVIGADGFGYSWHNGAFAKIPQVGVAVLEDDVEIGANACVDRARFGETRIGRGTKIDNLVQIAHNVRIGENCAFAALVGISGSTSVGNGVQVGGQTGTAGHIAIGDGVTLFARSGVSKSIPGAESGADRENLVWGGSPAKPMPELLREFRDVKALGKLRKTVKELEERLKKLEGTKDGC